MSIGPITPRRARQLWYAPVLGIATALMMVRLFALARLLDIPGFAQVSAAFLVSSTFTMLGCLGLQSLLQRDMPIMFVRGRETAARVLLAQAMVAAYATAAVAMLAAFLSPFDFGSPANLVALGLAHGLSQQLFVVSSIESRSRGEPLRFAMQSLARSVLIVAAGLSSAYATRSAVWVVVAELAVSFGLSHVLLRSTLAPRMFAFVRIGVATWRRIDWHAAWVLLLVALLGFALTYADRWGAAVVLDAHQFANYAFAGTIIAIGLSAQGLVNASVYPMLARLYARSGQAACYELCAKISVLAVAAGLALAVPAYFVLRFAVMRWYPAYDSAPALVAPFLVVAAFRVSDFWSSYLMIVGFQGRLLRTNLLAGAAVAVAWAMAVAATGRVGTPLGFAWLAVAFAVAGYGAVAWAARRTSREGASL